MLGSELCLCSMFVKRERRQLWCAQAELLVFVQACHGLEPLRQADLDAALKLHPSSRTLIVAGEAVVLLPRLTNIRFVLVLRHARQHWLQCTV